jgi:hypothetical protein
MSLAGSFKSPPPGTPISAPLHDPSLKLGQKLYDLYDPVARSNFRVVVIRPEEVERLDLSVPERVKWTLVDSDETGLMQVSEAGGAGTAAWKEVELWP